MTNFYHVDWFIMCLYFIYIFLSDFNILFLELGRLTFNEYNLLKILEFSVPVSPWAGLVIFSLDLKVIALVTTSLFLFNRKEKKKMK